MSYDQLARGYDSRGRIEQSYASSGVMSQREEGERQRSVHMRDEAMRNALSPEAKQRQQGSVTREMQQLEKNLHILAAAIDNLENRLMPVCLPIPETASGLRTSDGGGCALANQLAAFNSMLSVQTARIEMIYQGVDL